MSTQTSSFTELARRGFIDVPEALAEYGAPTTLAYYLVERHEPVVPRDLVTEYGISPSSLYPALGTLRDAGLVEREVPIDRPNAHRYRLSDAEQTEHPMKHD